MGCYDKLVLKKRVVIMFQDLEYALGEVEFRDGIPDLKFSRVRIVLCEYFS